MFVGVKEEKRETCVSLHVVYVRVRVCDMMDVWVRREGDVRTRSTVFICGMYE